MQTSSSGFSKDFSADLSSEFSSNLDIIINWSDRIQTLTRKVHSTKILSGWACIHPNRGKKDRGWGPWLDVTLGHHGEGGIDSTHWLLVIYISCCCCIQMDLGHPLWPVRDTAVSEVLSSWFLSCRAKTFSPTEYSTAPYCTRVGK